MELIPYFEELVPEKPSRISNMKKSTVRRSSKLGARIRQSSGRRKAGSSQKSSEAGANGKRQITEVARREGGSRGEQNGTGEPQETPRTTRRQ